MGNKMNEIQIDDIIGQDFFGAGITAKSVKEQLDAMGDVDAITVRVNSPGGDVFDGLAIFNLLKEHTAKITVKIDGLAASSASIIAMAGDEIVMGVGTQLMIHNPWTFALGEAKDLRKTADTLEEVKAGLIEVYQARVESDEAALSDWMDEEKWMRSEEAIELGFVDSSSDTQGKTMNAAGCRWINKAPEVEPEATPAPDTRPTYHDLLEQSCRVSSARASLTELREKLKA